MTDLATLVDRVQALAEVSRSREQSREERAEQNRAKAPEFAAFVADMRRVFSPGVRVTWVRWADGTEQCCKSAIDRLAKPKDVS